jgi:hypothetical protein
MGVDFKGKVSLRGNVDDSEGLWNSKCAIDRSMGFVVVSMFTNPVHLYIKLPIGVIILTKMINRLTPFLYV